MEIWKEIIGYDYKYYISSYGRVKSSYKDKIMNLFKHRSYNYNYLCVGLRKDKKPKIVLVHRLVAEYFINNVNNYSVVNHLDGDKLNNMHSNLEWTTHSGNLKHAWNNNLRNKLPLHNKGKFGFNHNRSTPIICSNGQIFGSTLEASRALNIPQSTIHYALSNKSKTRDIFFTYYQVAD